MNKDLSMLNDDDLMKVAGGYGEASIASGSFASSTGTALNLIVYWSVQDNGGQKILKVIFLQPVLHRLCLRRGTGGQRDVLCIGHPCN